jgi:hypothetical protein
MNESLSPAGQLLVSRFCSNLLTRYGVNHLTSDTLPEYLQAELSARAAVRSPLLRGSLSLEAWHGYVDWLARELACGVES